MLSRALRRARNGRIMIWNSIPFMTAIDLMIIAMTIYAIWRCQLIGPSKRPSAPQIGLRLIALGLLVVCMFYYTDLMSMYVFPVVMPAVSSICVRLSSINPTEMTIMANRTTSHFGRGKRACPLEALIGALWRKSEIKDSTAAAIAEQQGRLRAVHLSAHLETRALLNPEQVARTNSFRAMGGLWWLDPAVALAISAACVREDQKAWRGEECGCATCS